MRQKEEKYKGTQKVEQKEANKKCMNVQCKWGIGIIEQKGESKAKERNKEIVRGLRIVSPTSLVE